MKNYIEKFEAKHISDLGKKVAKFAVGDQIEVHNRIIEKSAKGEVKERIQIYKGTVIAYKKGGLRSAVTVRKISSGIGVEKTFPVYSPVVDKIVRKTIGKIRRAKLFYLRGLSGKKARITSKYVAAEKK
jgi:large subunit ribosomal protein L19